MALKDRSRVLKRDGHQCRNCGEDDTSVLTVHHVVPLSLGGNDTVSNCVTLCEPCHDKVHEFGRKDGISNLISEGLAARQESDDYHHGPAPLGFEKDSGELVESGDYHRVCEILDRVARGDMSQRQAAKELDCARKTIRTAIDERPELYGLQ